MRFDGCGVRRRGQSLSARGCDIGDRGLSPTALCPWYARSTDFGGRGLDRSANHRFLWTRLPICKLPVSFVPRVVCTFVPSPACTCLCPCLRTAGPACCPLAAILLAHWSCCMRIGCGRLVPRLILCDTAYVGVGYGFERSCVLAHTHEIDAAYLSVLVRCTAKAAVVAMSRTALYYHCAWCSSNKRICYFQCRDSSVAVSCWYRCQAVRTHVITDS